MAAPILYRSTDTSAPVLSGTTGSLVALLDACLCNGYGSKAAAGWTKAYSGTSKAAYRPGAGNQFYLRVQDDGPGAGTFKEARIVGYETMSDVDTGTNPFPTTAQLTTGLFVRKSTSADSTARNWILIANNRTFYLIIQSEGTAFYAGSMGFGDFPSYKSSDNYKTFIVGRSIENSAVNTNERLDLLSTSANSAVSGHFIARSYTGTGTSLTVSKTGDGAKGNSTLLSGIIPYPNAPDSTIHVAPVILCEGTSATIRGRLPGFWHWCHSASSINDGDTHDGAGDLAGRSFILFKQSGNLGVYCFETTEWDTSS